MSELERSKYFMFPSGKPGSIKSFKSAMTSGPAGNIEMRPVLRRYVAYLANCGHDTDETPNRTRTDAREAFSERDEDELGRDDSPASTCRDSLDPPMATMNTRRFVCPSVNFVRD